MQIYGLKNCDTCRKALKALPDAQLIDVRQEGISEELLNRALATFGSALVNTRSTTWRGLDSEEQQKPATDLLKQYPALMKRPLIVVQDELYLGWAKDTQEALAPE